MKHCLLCLYFTALLLKIQAVTLERNRKIECERRKRIKAVARPRRKSSSGSGQRVEIWIAVDGLSSSEDRVEVNDEDDNIIGELDTLPMVEVCCKLL